MCDVLHMDRWHVENERAANVPYVVLDTELLFLVVGGECGCDV
jgi:hypothetical protein